MAQFFKIWHKPLFTVLLIFFSISVFAQSIDPLRISAITKATVKVTVEGSATTGTGFYIAPTGELLTSWHIIESAFVTGADGKVTVRPIYIEESSGRKREVSVPLLFFNKLYVKAVENDYCMLAPVTKDGSQVPFLKTGDFSKLVSGQELYAAGFTTGSNQLFISKGWFMNRFTDSAFATNGGNRIKREAALMDITTSLPFSGGPVIRPGLTPADDEVVGWISFISSPYGHELNKLTNAFGNSRGKDENGDDIPSTVFQLLNNLFNTATTHISAFYSINTFLKDVKSIQ